MTTRCCPHAVAAHDSYGCAVRDDDCECEAPFGALNSHLTPEVAETTAGEREACDRRGPGGECCRAHQPCPDFPAEADAGEVEAVRGKELMCGHCGCTRWRCLTKFDGECCVGCEHPDSDDEAGITTAEVRDLIDEHTSSPWPEGCALCGYSGDDETGWTITATGPTVAPVCPTCAGPYVSLIAYLRHSMPSGQAISDLHALLDRVRREEGERIAQAIEADVLPSHPSDHYKDGFRRAAQIARPASVDRGEGL